MVESDGVERLTRTGEREQLAALLEVVISGLDDLEGRPSAPAGAGSASSGNQI